METLRYGIVGAGFVSQFHLRALESVRGVEVAGLTSRTPPHELAESARARGLGEARVFDSVREMAQHVDVVAIFNPNFCRVDGDGGDRGRGAATARGCAGLICEKPLARNLAEARRVVELASEIGAPTAYFENQIHMKMLQNARAQLAGSTAAMGPLTLARAAEEHGGPHSAWFWDPTLQGGGVLSDMGCHSLAVGWYLLTPAGSPGHVPRAADRRRRRRPAQVGPAALATTSCCERHGVDYSAHARRGLRDRHRDVPQSRDRAAHEGAVHGVVDVRQAGPAPARRRPRARVRARGEQPALAARDLHRRRRGGVGRPTPSSRSRRRPRRRACSPSNRTSPTSTATPTRTSTRSPRSATAATALLDFDYGLEVVRLTMAAYLSAEQGRAVDLTDDATLAALEDYVPLIQQGRGAEVLPVTP